MIKCAENNHLPLLFSNFLPSDCPMESLEFFSPRYILLFLFPLKKPSKPSPYSRSLLSSCYLDYSQDWGVSALKNKEFGRGRRILHPEFLCFLYFRKIKFLALTAAGVVLKAGVQLEVTFQKVSVGFEQDISSQCPRVAFCLSPRLAEAESIMKTEAKNRCRFA